ncbi:MAG: hypothetical protein HEP71_25575 [Roseivirga sp.]|nr:hypothetical protein [Roseivirga sp.]
MTKVGLIGDGVDKKVLQRYPLLLEKVTFITVEGDSEQVLYGDELERWIGKEEAWQGSGSEISTAVISLLLQSISSYDDISLSIAVMPLYPPEGAMKALTTALEWMSEEVQPDFLHIGFSSPEGKYQIPQNKWIEKLYNQGCKCICPSGIPPAFPASLNHILSVADQGFIEAGFGLSNPDVIIEEKEVPVYSHGKWVKHPVSNEVASALVLGNLIKERLNSSDSNSNSLIELPDLDDLDYLVFEQQGAEVETYTPPKQGFFRKVRLYTKSLLSRVITPTGKVPAFVKETRKVSCNGDGEAIGACDFRVRSKTVAGAFVCGACGCGDREGVLVDGAVPRFEKLDYPYVSCPASMPGFSNYLSSTNESNPSERKMAIETKFGKDALDKGQATQKKLTKRLDKRSNWLDGLS